MTKLVLPLLLLLSLASFAQTVLVGSNSIQSFTDDVAAGQAAAFKKTATVSGTADTLTIYVDSTNAATQLTVGIYSNSGTNPGTLLSSGVINSPVGGAWNSVSIPGTAITSGTVYWLTLLGNNGTPRWRDTSNCSVVQTSGTTGLSALPASWPVGTNFQWCNPSMYAWQQGAAQVGISISPTSASVHTGSTQQFAATVTNCGLNCGVNWSETGNGTVDLNGLYTAPATVETDTVTATAQADLTKHANASVTVTSGNTYTTNFPATENPISQGSKWTNGKLTGIDWSNVRTTTNKAFGTQTGATPPPYNDSIAVLNSNTGAWGNDQTVTATVYRNASSTDNAYEEIELLLRFTITAHSASGYEFQLGRHPSTGLCYVEIVRWNGPLNDYTVVSTYDPAAPCYKTGDILKATATGSTLTFYLNGAVISTASDSTKTGNPGIGLYFQGSGSNANFGVSSFTASN